MDAIRWEGDALSLLDQTRLPMEELWRRCTDYREVADAIRTTAVRGASAVGVAAGYAYCLAALEYGGMPEFEARMDEAKAALAASLPALPELSQALDQMEAQRKAYLHSQDLMTALVAQAVTIHRKDVVRNRAMGRLGAEIVSEGARILTHCNDGALATGGFGTVLGVIRVAHKRGNVEMVYVDETRPLLRGARLTTYELMANGIPVTLVTDSAAAALMGQHKVDLILVGCDRMAANGDFTHTTGTYGLAISAYYHGIPFYAVLPSSSVDLSVKSGKEIAIEERDPAEVTHCAGAATAPAGTGVWNPALDMTPNQLLTGIVTEKGVIYPPFDERLELLLREP
ncbi:MAG: S-methyl-5-thioribose-1-phosphate isomerase [Clostridiales bacterium]|nr:S-methyl-5-thioribose-1-phosphate isomerase [Clostridiales bacterium]